MAAVSKNCRIDDCRQLELNAEITRLQAELADAIQAVDLKDKELITEREYRRRDAEALADARELLREAIPHAWGNGAKDWVERAKALLENAEGRQS